VSVGDDLVPLNRARLPDIADAVGDEITVPADGGVRNVFKMVAMGAAAVMIGRV
jgi:L-lactate dehydrogenase (cytochrome)